MQGYDIPQNSGTFPLVFLLVSSSDHISPLTGLGSGATVTISKNGGSFASPSGAVSEIGNGWYRVAGNGADTNTLGPLILHATGTGADPTDCLYPIVAYNPQAGTNLGLSALPTVNPAASGGLPTCNAAGHAPVDLQTILGTASAGAAGYVGIDWAHISAPTTTVNLSGTTISTSQAVASVSGSVGSVTGLTTALVATAVWQDTTAGDFTVTGSIGKSLYTSGAVPGASGGLFIAGSNAATTVNFTGNLSGSVGSVTASVTVGAYASGEDPATLVLGATASSWNTTGTIGHDINSAGTASDPWTTALPGSYSAGTAGYLIGHGLAAAPPTAAAIATAVWTDTTAGDFTTASSPGKILVAQLGGTFTTTSSSVFSTASLANAPTGGSAPTTAEIATAVWQDLTSSSDFTTASSVGALVVANLNAAITSRMASGSVTVGAYASGQDPATLVLGATQASWVTSGTVGYSIYTAGAAPVVKNQALSNFPFYMALSSDHYSPGTGLTVTATRSLGGASFVGCANAPTEIGHGWYQINLAATDLNADTVALSFAATGCDTTLITLVPQQ